MYRLLVDLLLGGVLATWGELPSLDLPILTVIDKELNGNSFKRHFVVPVFFSAGSAKNSLAERMETSHRRS